MNKSKIFNLNKLYILIVILIIIIAFFIILNANINTSNLVNSYNFIPRGKNTFIYIKDFKNAKTLFSKTSFSQKLKNNYIYQDFKYKYSQDINLFFIKYNMNIEKLLEIINQDLLIGENNKDYYLAASVSFKSKLIYSILNILPDHTISELKYRNKSINYVQKGSGTIYYTLLEDYLIFTNETNIIQSMIDSYLDKQKNYNEDLATICTVDDVYISYELKENYNKYRLLPEIMNVSLKINLRDYNTKLIGEPNEAVDYNKTESINNMSVLKYFNKNFSLFYYNGVYNFKDQISILVNNYRVEADDKNQINKKRDAQSNLKVFENIDNGAFFALNDLKLLKVTPSILPEICTIIKFKDGLNDKDRIDSLNKILNIFGFLFDVKSWAKDSKKFERYKDKESNLSIISYDNFVYFVYGESFSNSIVNMIEKNQSSLYDKYYDKIKNSASTFFICLNSFSISQSFEPIFQEYLNTKINLNKDEYNNSFGQFFSYLKEQDALYLTMSYIDNGKKLTGNLEYVK